MGVTFVIALLEPGFIKKGVVRLSRGIGFYISVANPELACFYDVEEPTVENKGGGKSPGAAAVAGKEGHQVRVFLMADAVACGKAGQKVPEGYYNIQLMLGKIVRKGEVLLCGTCMDARGLLAEELMEGALRGTLAQLADWTVEADKVLVF